MLEKLRSTLVKEGFAKEEEIYGCTEEEVEKLEKEFGVKLPIVYKIFLKLIGRGAGLFLSTERCYYPDLFLLPERVKKIVMDENLEHVLMELPPDAFVFWVHQDYEFFFFRTNEGDDPPVYYYLELETQYVKFTDNFSAFIGGELRKKPYKQKTY